MVIEATIKISTVVKSQLDRLRLHPRETYHEVILRLIVDALKEEDEMLKEEDIRDIEEAIEAI